MFAPHKKLQQELSKQRLIIKKFYLVFAFMGESPTV
jgi:hypothetical protein